MLRATKIATKGAKLDLSITHNGFHWIAKNNDFYVSAIDLKQLDLQLKQKVKAGFKSQGKDFMDVFMTFDNQTVPEWIRQYSNHYFNRRVRIYFD